MMIEHVFVAENSAENPVLLLFFLRFLFNSNTPLSESLLLSPAPHHFHGSHTCTVLYHDSRGVLVPGASHVRAGAIARDHLPRSHLRPSHTCTIPLTPQPLTPAPHGTTMASQWRPIAAHAHAYSVRCTRRCQSESCAPLVRCARSRRALAARAASWL